MRDSIQAITFDVGGTLIDPWPSVGHVYAKAAEQHGVRGLSPHALNASFLSAWQALGGQAESKEDWATVVQATFDGLGPFPQPSVLFETLYARFAEPNAWRVFDDVRPTLDALRNKNVRLGVLSNWDERLRPLLHGLGLADCFEVIVVSCEVGYRKPEPEIFRHTAQAFGLVPARMLHVGDSREHDVEGALRAGMQAAGIHRGTRSVRLPWLSGLGELLQLV